MVPLTEGIADMRRALLLAVAIPAFLILRILPISWES